MKKAKQVVSVFLRHETESPKSRMPQAIFSKLVTFYVDAFMNINSDFSQKAVINTLDLGWNLSPVPGIERKYLDRVGDELARASSLVKYGPESSFAEHIHGGGEEILILEGTFSDEHGDYPAGTYIRNPPNS